jgi:AAA+ ATPase superfamily predicted ATPase
MTDLREHLMPRFVGRASQLRELARLLPNPAGPAERPAKALLIRGRRRVGKSRLVEEFLDRAGVPYVFFTASTRSTAEELSLFTREVAESNLPGAPLFQDVQVTSWDAALRLLAAALPPDGPSVIVIDEIPYLIASDPSFEGTLQKVFDRDLSRLPVLLIGIGSDLAMMETLNEYGRPFHQRATEMVVPPLSPAEVGDLLHLEPAAAFDAYLITGGLPLVCADWAQGQSMWDYLRDALSRSTSPLLVSGERSLAAEFPPSAQARAVLEVIGSGETTFTAIGRQAGGIQQTSLSRALRTLVHKRVVAAEAPLSTAPSKETRYRVADPHLRFWLRFLGPGFAEIERGRGDRVLERIQTSWESWRGRAVEPVVREALHGLGSRALGLGDGPAPVVGGYWTRTNDVEIDVVLADRAPVAKKVLGVGSIKWRERAPFDMGDYAALSRNRDRLPGATAHTSLLAVSRVPSTVPGVTILTPADLIAAW